jgi:hypothetical protein
MELFGNQIEALYILLWIIFLLGVFYTFKEHGRNKYNQGMSDAICMHHTGTLKYKITPNKNGEEDIEIEINGG